MNGDLISRKETERILRAYADDVGCNRGEYEMANGILKAVCCMKEPENVPTAYDVEEVIHQLEENKESVIKTIENLYRKLATLEMADPLKELIEEYTRQQIEIVESGGTAVGQKGERE